MSATYFENLSPLSFTNDLDPPDYFCIDGFHYENLIPLFKIS